MIGAAEPVEDLQLGGGEGELAVLVLTVEGRRASRRDRAARRRWPSGRSGRRACARRRRRGGRATTSSASAGRRSPSSPRRSSGRSKTPSTYASAAPGRTIPGRARPPSSRSSACASTVLPAPVSPVRTFSPRGQPQLCPLDQQEVLDAKLTQHARKSSSARRRIAGSPQGSRVERGPSRGPSRGRPPRYWTAARR